MMDDILKQIKAGTSMPRNMFLFNNAIYLLPYTGVGSDITRALDEDINVTFMNNDKAQEFVITLNLDTLTLQKCHCLISKGI